LNTLIATVAVDSNAAAPYTYLWSTGSTLATSNVTNNGVDGSVVTYFVTTTNACGMPSIDSVKVINQIVFNLTFDMPDTIITACSNINPLVTLSNFAGATGPFTYTWSNSSTGNPTTFTNTGNNGDSTYLTVSVMDNCSNVKLDSVLIINDYIKTDLSILPNDTLYNNCPTNTLIATVAVDSNAAAPYTYLWSTGSTLTTSNVTNNGVNGSVVTYFVSTTNICGMTSIDSVKVINQIVNPIATLMQNDTIYSDCILDSALAVVVGSSGIAPYTYLWNNTSINDSTYIQDLIGVNGGSIPFNVTVIDACGNSGVANGVMIVDMTLHATLTQTPSTCNPTGTSTSTVTGSIGTNDYQWIGPGLINPDTLITQNIANLPSGWYYYTVIDDVCSYSDSIFVDLIQNPSANISANPMSTSGPATITFTNTSTLANSYVWDYGNGLSGNTSSLVSTTSIYTEPGFYTITLTAINGGCSDIDSVTIEILAHPVIVNEPNVFTPDGDGINDLFFITTLNVTSMNLVIMNRWGNVLYDVTSANPTWDGEDYPDGVYYYMYTATGINGEILTGRGFFHIVDNN
jgi:gliding motility-associated-like protein